MARSIVLVTALNPYIGYAAATDIAQEALRTGRSVSELVLEKKLLTSEKLSEILKKRARDESDFQLRIVVNPTVLDRLRNEDEALLIALEKKYFGKLSFRSEPSFHSEQFKIFNASTNEELVSVGG